MFQLEFHSCRNHAEVFLFVFLGKSLQVAMQRAPNLLSHLQQKAGEESAPTGA